MFAIIEILFEALRLATFQTGRSGNRTPQHFAECDDRDGTFPLTATGQPTRTCRNSRIYSNLYTSDSKRGAMGCQP